MNAKIVRALKSLTVALDGSGTTDEITQNSVAGVLENLAENYERPADGAKGADGADGEKGDTGAHVTAMALTVADGVVTGGTATLSDSSTITITVTT